ncbi:SAM-dependent methyltransferase [Actinomadura napierensis]|uniref:SAM-dependent methyltransferase n=1 Tax=Actinomadura napierensis TaxID=267854 RepID=A0ABP5JLM2_9ACTN
MAEEKPADGGAPDAPAFDTSVAHIARIQDYWLGGKDNYEPDREAAEQAIAALPDMVASVRNTRAFLARAVRFLAAERGVRQFLDIGTGIPTADNTHEVAQAAAPDSRVVYVDNDPVVLAHARALLTGTPSGATSYIDADIRDTAAILDAARQILDFDRPIAVMLIAIMQYVPDESDPYGVVRTLVDAVPSGSFVAISHPATDIQAKKMANMADRLNEAMAQTITLRSHDQVAAFLDGLDLVEPGLVRAPEWRPDDPALASTPSTMWSGVALKP